jgi:hypothetical protein
MSEITRPDSEELPPTLAWRIDDACNQFERAWRGPSRPRIEDFVGEAQEPDRSALIRELILLDLEYRRRNGETPTPNEYQAIFLTQVDLIASVFAEQSPSDAEQAASARRTAHRRMLRETLIDSQRTAPQNPPPAPAEHPASALTELAALPGYEILGLLGRGGMGVVYHARQTRLKRLVALKMILAGAHAGPKELERFRLEAEAIARLQHPNVVQIYDVSEHEGKPYFSLEFVDGGSLHNTLTGTPLPAREAARLVETLARAMQAAHQLGVIHRDLKPANVLLTKAGTPKITDFGLAKLLGQDSGQSHTGQIMGTPSYMAPEQAAGNVKIIGAAADIYALGAILYELLTGRPPFKAASVLDTLEQVRTQEPVPPSQLQPKTPRDLETICLKCLQKEPAKRYDSAASLADDLQRFLNGEPIHARPVGQAERLWRWCKRQPALSAASAAAVLGVLLALVTFAIAFFVVSESLDQEYEQRLAAENLAKANKQLADDAFKLAKENKRVAEAERLATKQAVAAADKERQATALAVDRLGQIEKANHLMESIFTDIDPRAGEKGGPLVIEQLTKRLLATADKLDEQAIRDPLAVARLRNFLGKTLRSLGEPNKAIELHARARAAFEEGLGPDHPDTLTSMNNLALGYEAAGKLDLALPLYEETLKRTGANLGPDHPDTLSSMNNLASGYLAASKLDLALPLFEETLKLRRAKLGPDHPNTVQSMNNLAVAYQGAGKLDLALPLLQETLKLMRAKHGPDHPHTLTSMNNLALGYKAAGKLDLALPLFEETLKLRKAKLGADHPHTLNSMNSLAYGYHAAGKLDLALPLLEETVKLTKAKLGPDHPNTLRNMNNLAQGYRAAGKLDLGLPLLQEAAAGMEKRRFQHEYALGIVVNLIACHEQLKQFDQAEPWRRKWLAVVKERSGADSLAYAGELAALGLNLLAQKKSADAEAVLRECLGVRQKKAADVWTTFSTQAMLGASLLGQKKYKEAEPLLREGYEGMKQREKTIPPQGKVRLIEAAEQLVELYEATGNAAQAERYRKELAQRKAADKGAKK